MRELNLRLREYRNWNWRAIAGIVLVAIAIGFPYATGTYIIYLASVAGIGVIVALGLNIGMGYCGVTNLGVSGWYGIAAYTCTLLQLRLGLNFFVAVLVTLAVSILITAIISVPLLRLRHMFLALGTMAFASVIQILIEGLIGITGGEEGLAVPKTILFGHQMGELFSYYLILISVIVCYLVSARIASSRVGRAMRSIAQDEVAALAMGINALEYRRLALIINGLFASLAGCLWAQFQGFIGPANFTIWFSLVAVLMVVIGGIANNIGAVLGGIVMMLLPEQLSAFQEYLPLVYGMLLVLVLVFMPRGIMGLVESVRLKIASIISGHA